MKQRIILVHGWGSYPQKDWFPWAIAQLSSKGYEVIAPEMPSSLSPEIDNWIPYLSSQVGEIRKDDIFIGHSIGCQTILRFLESVDGKVNKVVLIAPWMKLTDEAFDDEEDAAIAKPWLQTPIDFEKVKTKAEKFIAIFSEDDPYVPMQENVQIFIEKLGAEIIEEKGFGHFSQDDGVTKIPLLMNLI